MWKENRSMYLPDNSTTLDSYQHKNPPNKTNMLPKNTTLQTTTATNLTNVSLSDIILNYQDFWHNKICE